MADPVVAGYKITTLVGMGAGATVSAMLMNGPLPIRLLAGAVGGLFAVVGTPLFAPLVEAVFIWLYGLAGVDPARIPADSVHGFTGFALGVLGIDICRWLVDFTKSSLAKLRIPR
jgi:hypothetical protein